MALYYAGEYSASLSATQCAAARAQAAGDLVAETNERAISGWPLAPSYDRMPLPPSANRPWHCGGACANPAAPTR